ncbi:type IV pili methyl-accepting chemotaxis transducer N-terminal domain-containing protein [Thiorhodococcus minor]|uniref:Sensor protein n=1 Tax=Thiorhodococcus minor TaxID=57489 RepID=A0A6M0K043_9GAMM|nr:type IV pili methyl-accepting chemotaxis transducer N-terminal domain-containing protein [Thiorhodococcus minor]NEV63100.1 HAMP domain-containing protein [Thiorhodococcus minor]
MAEQRDQQTSHSILITVGVLMAGVVLLGITGMVSSIVIAQINQGMAAAVNQSGTLRMQSYRIGVALASEAPTLEERQAQVLSLVEEYAERLASPRLTAAIPTLASDPVSLAYERVRWRWTHEMRRAALRFVEAGADSAAASAGRQAYLGQVDDFVDDIHTLVRVLEDRSEHRILLLRWIQGVVLALTLAVVAVTMILVQRRIVRPIAELVSCADRTRRGDFSGRTRFTGTDELGRVGAALNLMTQGLSQIYGELEERVADKTLDLARSNRSLTLLYRTSRALETSHLTDELLQKVLDDVRSQLGLAAVALCLRDPDSLRSGDCISASQSDAADAAIRACSLCTGPEPDSGASPDSFANGERIASFPVRDQGRSFGTLRVAFRPHKAPETWQQPLLESLAAHLATALNLMSRMHEGRRLALHEERSILARELHDSLAQSLSYLKIQAARLDAALREAGDRADSERGASADSALPPPAVILSEIREGISSAYRQLRELLTTFRLRIVGQGLANALAETVQEFRERSDVEISFDDQVPSGLLSPNEEVHVMQIIREALSNVVRHAEARRCTIRLETDADRIRVSIADDGKGLGAKAAGRGHYGMTIMRERALTLGGSLDIESAGSGASVHLSFRPRGRGVDA